MYSYHLTFINIILEQDASSGVDQFYKVKNRSHEWWNPFSPAVEKLHLEYHNGFSNGLTQVTCHSNKTV